MRSFTTITAGFLAAAASIVNAADMCPSGAQFTSEYKTVVEDKFAKFNIIPGVVAKQWNPTVRLRVDYPDQRVHLGNMFSTVETTSEPVKSFTPEQGYSRKYNYTIIMCDPDATSPDMPVARYFLHQLKYNTHPCAPNSGMDQTTYQAPTPPSEAPHRYLFLVYRQPEGTYTPPSSDPAIVTRTKFHLKQYVKEGNLKLVGGNFLREGATSMNTNGST